MLNVDCDLVRGGTLLLTRRSDYGNEFPHRRQPFGEASNGSHGRRCRTLDTDDQGLRREQAQQTDTLGECRVQGHGDDLFTEFDPKIGMQKLTRRKGVDLRSRLHYTTMKSYIDIVEFCIN